MVFFKDIFLRLWVSRRKFQLTGPTHFFNAAHPSKCTVGSNPLLCLKPSVSSLAQDWRQQSAAVTMCADRRAVVQLCVNTEHSSVFHSTQRRWGWCCSCPVCCWQNQEEQILLSGFRAPFHHLLGYICAALWTAHVKPICRIHSPELLAVVRLLQTFLFIVLNMAWKMKYGALIKRFGFTRHHNGGTAITDVQSYL